MDYKDYYKILGVDKKSGADDIKKAYRKLAVKYHPDKNGGDKAAEDQFKLISEAYEVLGDEEKRKKYDALGENWHRFQQAGNKGQNPYAGGGYEDGGGFAFEGDLSDLFGNRGNAQRGGSQFSDFFEAFFASEGNTASGFARQQQRAGRDFEAEVNLSLEEAYTGTARILELPGEKLRINIKPGAYSGQLLRIRGKGEKKSGGGKAGNLLVRLQVTPHPKFTRKEDDLYAELPVDLYTAVLGGTAMADTLSGKVKVTIPAGTQSGHTIRLRGKGMPVYNSQEHGNLYLKIKVGVPQNLSPQQRQLFEQLKNMQ